MAKRRASGLIKGFSQGYELAGNVMRDRDVSQVANAQAENVSGYTPADGQQLEAMANAKDEQGNPYYTVNASEDGKYSVTPNFQTEGQTASPIEMPTAMRTNFMGKSYDKQLSDGEINSARQMALAGVYKKHGDIDKAMRIEQSATDNARNAKLDARAEQEHGWRADDRKRAESDRKSEDDFKMSKVEAFTKLKFTGQQRQYMQEMGQFEEATAKYQESLKQGIPPQQLGTPPKQPQKPEYTVADSLSDHAAIIEHDAKFGKVDMNAVQQLTSSLAKIKEEGYAQALHLANSGAPLASVLETFNKTGSSRIDPSQVLSDSAGKDANGLPTRLIQYKDVNGEVKTIDTLAQLNAIGQADKATKLVLDVRADGRKANEEKRNETQMGLNIAESKNRIAVSNAASGRAGATSAREAQAANASFELWKERNPKATPAETAAAKAGILSPIEKQDNNAPHEVKLARELVKAGNFLTAKEALDFTTKKDKSVSDLRNSIIAQGIKNMVPAETAVKNADAALAAAGYGTKSTPAASIPDTSKREIGKTYDTPKGKMIWRGTGWEATK